MPRYRQAVSTATFLAAGILACSDHDSSPTVSVSSVIPPPEQDGAGWSEPADGGSDEQCYALARGGDDLACSDCCVAIRPTAKTVIWDTLRACVCRKPNPSCSTECGAAYCQGSLTYDDAEATNKKCLRCLEAAWDGRDEDCMATISDACDADEECARSFACDTTCEALAKKTAHDAGTPIDADR